MGLVGSNVVAMDCEMVGVGPTGTRSVLARVSIVDCEGNVLLDKTLRCTRGISMDFRQPGNINQLSNKLVASNM